MFLIPLQILTQLIIFLGYGQSLQLSLHTCTQHLNRHEETNSRELRGQRKQPVKVNRSGRKSRRLGEAARASGPDRVD